MALALKDVYRELQINYRGYEGVMAAPIVFPRIFLRDKYRVDQLDPNQESMRQAIKFGAARQGRKFDRLTGEIPGAFPHEVDLVTGIGVELPGIPGYNTLYNAHDIPADWLNNLKLYQLLYSDNNLAVELNGNLTRATDYIYLHTQNNESEFRIDPGLCHAKRFALNVTDWRDSVVPGRKDGKFHYPAVITLLQAQNMSGLESAAYILDTLPNIYQDSSTEEASWKAKAKAKLMREALIGKLYDYDQDTFLIAKDERGKITGVSSDSLHLLYYVRPDYLPQEQLRGLLKSSQVLETEAGYVGLDPSMAATMRNLYHAANVWPFEQAFINAGARVHLEYALRKGFSEEAELLRRVIEVSSRVMEFIKDSDPEILDSRNGFKGGGGNPQAWTVAAKEYFKVTENLPETTTLYPIPATFYQLRKVAA